MLSCTWVRFSPNSSITVCFKVHVRACSLPLQTLGTVSTVSGRLSAWTDIRNKIQVKSIIGGGSEIREEVWGGQGCCWTES